MIQLVFVLHVLLSVHFQSLFRSRFYRVLNLKLWIKVSNGIQMALEANGR